MQWKHLGWIVYAFSLLISDQICSSQVVPAAHSGNQQQITLGIGPSIYDVDWGHGRLIGGTIWGDWYPRFLPSRLYGTGIEAEVRDISLNQSSSQTNFRQDTASGGPIYSWRRFNSFRPYAKFLVGFGSMDFKSRNPDYSHDTRTIFAPGGGFEVHALGPLWARADFEYQIWGPMFRGGNPDPAGVTAGVEYAFGTGGFYR